jgi:hypothetical protein
MSQQEQIVKSSLDDLVKIKNEVMSAIRKIKDLDTETKSA